MEMTDQHKVFCASTILFEAGSAPSSRRTASVGPGIPDRDHDLEEAQEHISVPNLQHPNVPVFHTRSASVDPRHFSSAINGRDNTVVQHDTRALHQDSLHLPTPPYSPPSKGFSFTPDHRPSPAHSRSGSISQSSGHPKPEDSPAQTLEDLRRALMSNTESGQPSAFSFSIIDGISRLLGSSHHGPLHTSPAAASSASSIYSYRHRSLSRQPSIEDITENELFSGQTPSRRSSAIVHRSPSLVSNATVAQTHEDTHRGRKNTRFSLSAVASAIDTMVERVRSRSPRAESQRRSKSGHRDAERGRTLDRRNGELLELPTDENERYKHHSTLAKVGELLGLEEERKEVGDGWKEFKKGRF